MRCLAACLLVGLSGPARGEPELPLRDVPVIWYADDDAPIPVPAFDEPGLVPAAARSFLSQPFSRFFHPGRFCRWVGTGDRADEAADINALDEVVNSTWFTNRIGLRPLSADELAAGPGLATGPDRSEPWVIIGAKIGGVTPGFRIRDARGDVWLLKFDPPDYPGMTTRAGVVANLILHAVGFNTPVDRVVAFDRTDLAVAEGVTMKLQRTLTVPLTTANLDSVLQATGSGYEGKYHGLASRYLDGVPLGPINDQDRRQDDPNDLIDHQDRRSWRALRVFAAWLNHFDTKMHNSLDMYVGEPGQGYVRHYLIDFASTLGAFGDEPVKRFGYEFGIDFFPILGRTLALGLHEDPWVALERPEGLSEVGLFDVETFDPLKWKPDWPHSAMANLTRRDGYWAAKIVSAFTDDDLRVLVEQARYRNPEAAEYLVATLAGRRDKIARAWFAEVPPVDFFTAADGGVAFRDLGVERGYAPADRVSYRYRIAEVDSQADIAGRTDWTETRRPFIPWPEEWPDVWPDAGGAATDFVAIECQRGLNDAWSSTTTVYLSSRSGRIVALDR